MDKLTLIILGIIITFISYLIIYLWNKSKYHVIFSNLFESQLNDIGLVYPLLDIRSNYVTLRRNIFLRFFLYLLLSCATHPTLTWVNIIMFLDNFDNIPNIKKTIKQLHNSSFSEPIKYRKYFIFQPVFLTLYHLILTLLLCINILLIH